MSRQISLKNALKIYSQALSGVDGKPENWLAILLARDDVGAAIEDTRPISRSTIQEISKLDLQLRSKLNLIPPEEVGVWRDVVQPSETYWWWWEEKKSAERAQRRDLPWEIFAGTLLLLSSPLMIDIIKRLWNGAPDTISIFGTILTLLITASPLVKEGRSAVQWVLKSSAWPKAQHPAKTMVVMSLLIFLVLLATQQWVLPYPLANYYNNEGAKALANNNLTLAQQSFRRAAALNPDHVVPYHNIAQAYEQTGLLDKAKEWYQNALEEDANFAPAYKGLGQTYNEQGEFAAAEKILIAGLTTQMKDADEVTVKVARYELLANLGWSYFEQGKSELAKETLLMALGMEDELRQITEATGDEYRLAMPHFYLAQIYEQSNDLPNARLQWEESLRFLDASNWYERERFRIADQHLQRLADQ